MKLYNYILLLAILTTGLVACDKDDENDQGKPVISNIEFASSAFFGDSILFSASVADEFVPLSTLKAQLYYGEEMVSETVIRTKTNGTYSGKIFIPFLANVPNGTATLKFVLQNINFTLISTDEDLVLSRPDFPYLTLHTSEGESYKMERTGLYTYAVTGFFPQKLRATISAPAYGVNGNPITFGWEDGRVMENAIDDIPFNYSRDADYEVSFNTYTYEAEPFLKVMLDGEEMTVIDSSTYELEVDLETGQELTFIGIDWENWWIDPDFFEYMGGDVVKFIAQKGKYKITASYKFNYFGVQYVGGQAYEVIRIIGDGIGKPSLENVVSWSTSKALTMVKKSDKIFQITLIAGLTVNASEINFKFFGGTGWDNEFKHDKITSETDLIIIKDGDDDGNLAYAEDKSLIPGKTYVFTLDLTAGNDKAKLYVEEK